MNFDNGNSAAIPHAFGHREERSGKELRQASNAGITAKTESRSDIHSRIRRSRTETSEPNDFKLGQLAMLSLSPVVRSIQNWWLHRAERHYLICADVEQQRAREAQMNVAYYQKRAALARSARM